MKSLSKFFVLIFVIIFAVAGCFPATAENANAEKLIESIINYNLKETSSTSVQDWIDGYLTENADAGTEWYVIALSNYGKYDFSSYKKALNSYLSENEIGSASSRLKFALALIATGDKESHYITDFLENSVGEQGIMSFIFGLHILNNGYSCEKYSVKTLTDELISLQSADGGWSLTGKSGDVDVTAMTVQVLASQYRSNKIVKTATDKAISFLASRQNADGTYSSYGVSNPESIAQVIIALSSLGINAEKDPRFIKNSINLFDALDGFRSENGGYCHQKGKETSSTATVQVLCSAVAFKKMKDSGSPFYIFSEKDNQPTKTTTVKKPEVTEAEKTKETEETLQETTTTFLHTEHGEETSSKTQTTTAISEKKENNQADFSYKAWITVAITAVCVCSVFLVTKRKS